MLAAEVANNVPNHFLSHAGTPNSASFVDLAKHSFARDVRRAGPPHAQFGAHPGVKLYTGNVLKHGSCCDPSCFEGARIAKLLPHVVPRLAWPLDGR